MADGGTRSRLLRLAAELSHEGAAADRIAADVLVDAQRLEQLQAGSAPGMERGAIAVLALGLHRWYCAVEAIVERIERAFGTPPVGHDWHHDLLTGAMMEIPQVRPAILPPEHLERFRELLRFRHFLRHAYAVELDREKLLVLAAHLRVVHSPVSRSISMMEKFVTDAAQALDA